MGAGRVGTSAQAPRRLSDDRLTFFPSDLVLAEAAAVFAAHAARIRERLPDAEILHTGATSIPGMLTAGDVDLHVRVDEAAFPAAREVLLELYEPHAEQGWTESSMFVADPDADPRVEIALTVIGSVDDHHFSPAWGRIAADPALADAYNALKRDHEGGSVDAYKAAKAAFFRDNFPVSQGRATDAARPRE